MKVEQAELKTHLRFLPFGHAVVEVRVGDEVPKPKEEGARVYAEPGTTNTRALDITYDGENYAVPKTTGGLQWG